jgi:hypothetical protein
MTTLLACLLCIYLGVRLERRYGRPVKWSHIKARYRHPTDKRAEIAEIHSELIMRDLDGAAKDAAVHDALSKKTHTYTGTDKDNFLQLLKDREDYLATERRNK